MLWNLKESLLLYPSGTFHEIIIKVYDKLSCYQDDFAENVLIISSLFKLRREFTDRNTEKEQDTWFQWEYSSFVFKSRFFQLAKWFQTSHSKFLGLSFLLGRMEDCDLILVVCWECQNWLLMQRTKSGLAECKRFTYANYFSPGALHFCPTNKMETVTVLFTEPIVPEMLIPLHI